MKNGEIIAGYDALVVELLEGRLPRFRAQTRLRQLREERQ